MTTITTIKYGKPIKLSRPAASSDIFDLLVDVKHALNAVRCTGYVDSYGNRSDTYELAARVSQAVREIAED